MIAQAMPVIVWLLPVVGLLVGGALLARSGLRGRQLDNHPICRRCGFDLYGSFRSEICPECGSAITRANVRLGNYERRPARAAAGIFLMLPAATVLAAVGVAAARGVQWDHHKPLWLLLREGDTRALMELERRRAASLLTPAQVNAVVERALSIQRDRRRPWLVEWGDFVERVAAGGGLSVEQRRRYAWQAVHFELDADTLARPEAGLQLRVRSHAPRLGARSWIDIDVRVAHASLAGLPLKRHAPHRSGGIGRRYMKWTQRVDYLNVPLDEPFVATLPDAPHPLDVRVGVTLVDRFGYVYEREPLRLPPLSTLRVVKE